MLFRHMFYCKHVERLLCNVWISNKDFHQYSLRSPKWLVSPQPEATFRQAASRPHALFSHRFAAAFALRQRMLNFVQNIQYYMMFEVMEPTWHVMENNLKTVS